MKEGYWINYETGKEFPIYEHETWIRDYRNAKKLGISDKVYNSFKKFKEIKDREKLLVFAMKNAPIMRVRGHGNYASFEFATRDTSSSAIRAIQEWGEENAGEFTGIYIVNLATGETVDTVYGQFSELMDSGGPEAVLRVACKKVKFSFEK